MKIAAPLWAGSPCAAVRAGGERLPHRYDSTQLACSGLQAGARELHFKPHPIANEADPVAMPRDPARTPVALQRMSASHQPAPTSSRLPPSALQRSDDHAGWGEESAVFELPAPRALPPGSFDDTPALPAAAYSREPSTPAPPLGDVGALFSNYRAYVAKIGRRILGPSSEVDDLIQDVFLTTVRDAHKIKDPARLSSWLGTVTTRMAKRRRFRTSHQPVANEDLDELVDVAREEGPG